MPTMPPYPSVLCVCATRSVPNSATLWLQYETCDPFMRGGCTRFWFPFHAFSIFHSSFSSFLVSVIKLHLAFDLLHLSVHLFLSSFLLFLLSVSFPPFILVSLSSVIVVILISPCSPTTKSSSHCVVLPQQNQFINCATLRCVVIIAYRLECYLADIRF